MTLPNLKNDFLKKIQTELNNIKKLMDLDIDSVRILAEKLSRTEGLIGFSGIGKSGIIAKKNAMTFSSLGIPAVYLHPLDALHGDLGILKRGDLVFIYSKSGNGQELKDLISSLRNLQVDICGVSMNSQSFLIKNTNYPIVIPNVDEIDQNGIAPTTSTAVFMIFGDVLGSIISQSMDFTLNDFASFHPGGTLGKRILLKVSDIMFDFNEIPIVKSGSTVFQTIVEMSKKSVGLVSIVDDSYNILGVFTDVDLRRLIPKKELLEKTLISEFMTKNPITVSQNELAINAFKIMKATNRGALPVLDNNQVKGVIRLLDIINLGIDD